MTDVVLAAELGPNPAPLVEALWALYRHRGLRVCEAFVLTSRRGRDHLNEEVLAPGESFDQLRDALGDAALPRHRLQVHVALDPSGAPLEDEHTPEQSAAWNEARWRLARAALRAADERSVVFTLAGGRRRTSSAVQTVVFQLLGRGRDLLVDVRVGDHRVEGARARFFFPEQRHQRLAVGNDTLLAREVPVHLVDVEVPRLRRLLTEDQLVTYAHAVAAGGHVVEQTLGITVRVQFGTDRVLLNGQPVPFTSSEFVWFAALCTARKHGIQDGWLRNDDLDTPRSVLRKLQLAKGSAWKPAALGWREVLRGEAPVLYEESLSTLRSKCVRKFEAALTRAGLARATVRQRTPYSEVVVADGKVTRWFLPFAPEDIEITEGPEELGKVSTKG